MSDFVTRYILTLFSASAILAVGVILLMLSIPFTNEWKQFRTVRLCLAFTCLAALCCPRPISPAVSLWTATRTRNCFPH